MLGPLFSVAALRVLGAPLKAAPGGRHAGQWAIGTALGLYFTPDVINLLLANLALVSLIAGGSLDDVKRVVKVVVFVASTPDFTGQPKVANGASELLGEVFGDAGKHARSAVGVSVLPLDVPVEVEIIVEV